MAFAQLRTCILGASKSGQVTKTRRIEKEDSRERGDETERDAEIDLPSLSRVTTV